MDTMESVKRDRSFEEVPEFSVTDFAKCLSHGRKTSLSVAVFTDAVIQTMSEALCLMSAFGLHISAIQAYKKYAHRKYGRRYAYRWLSKTEKQEAVYNAVAFRVANSV